MGTARGPLADLTVVELTSTFLGPYCSLLLAQLGARVVKVEPPEGDIVRYVADERRTGMGPAFLNFNRGKESVVLDVGAVAGREALDRLIDGADVFLHNMRPAAMRRLRIDPDTVLARNPRVVYCHAVGFGSAGPYRDEPAYDDVVQGVSGLAAVQGGRGEPEYVRTQVVDKTVGVMAVAAVLAALHERDVSGVGQAVEVPMFESMAAFLLMEQQGARVHAGRTGGTGYARTASPYRKPYRTADDTISVLLYTDAQWATFFRLVDRPDLADDPALRGIRGRTERIDELYALVETELAARTTAAWLELLRAHAIPAMPVNSVEDLFADEHLTAVGLFEDVAHPTEGPLVQARLPWTFSRSGAPHLPGAPALGEHSGPVLRSVGLDDAAVRAAGGAPQHPAGEPPAGPPA
ncbi:CaiB/BaiF CoA transferase family protein [Blastococcus xanthinilyticus]|uniref:Crotonobetainyl-CoA:carnitine CoA-transferase CaiB-like acyl-CoA transferase n=1 Tax=Blastococcus xanthinilyticus TaxID=1564164 RepID=A0A5S5CR79_9ACTN|nr:CoA transferase [Blastococcus xanthinilyticus]TYP82923.1 crotonobetainyl-CoA:carnitine CoA-transferase CaiB-like acyl-CoA transferase [Blastococcus xanthinilyticus]